MVGLRARIAACLALTFCALLLIVAAIPVEAGIVFGSTHAGHASGPLTIVATGNGTIVYNASSTSRFDILVMTEENYGLLEQNKSYGYIQELSAINVTQVQVRAEIGPGSYEMVVYFREAGNVWVSEPEVSYPSATGFSVPLDTVLVGGISILAGCAITFIFVKRYYR